ncbi:MAG: radical SAM protein [Methanomicrobiales archaeon]
MVLWNLTDRCNLSCTHCYNQSGPKSPTDGEFTTAETLKVIDDLAQMGVPLILFTGGNP